MQELRRCEYVALGPVRAAMSVKARIQDPGFTPGGHLGAEAANMYLSLTLHHNQLALR